ncbi:MAG: zinc-binding alcohol dehydrogenase family protein, partial [Mesorhizobium sp.]
MRAIQLNRFGGPDVLDMVAVPKPEPQAGEVLVRVRAAGVNFFE